MKMLLYDLEQDKQNFILLLLIKAYSEYSEFACELRFIKKTLFFIILER